VGHCSCPADFGQFSNDLLVGNFSYVDSEINAFDPISGALLGTILVDPGSGQTAGGLWALDFGNGGSNGSPDTLYIADGIDGETHGLFAAITPAPEPSTLALLGSGVLSLYAWRRRSPRRRDVAAG
jgi:PEP-CTERM motif